MTTTTQTHTTPSLITSIWHWLRDNLLTPWYNALITIIVTPIVAFVLYRILAWIFFAAEWDVVKQNLRLFMVGPYPQEELWRSWVTLGIVVLLSGLSWGAWRGREWTAPISVVVLGILGALFLPITAASKINLLIMAAIFVGGQFLGAWKGEHLRKYVVWLWVLSFFIVLIILWDVRPSSTPPFFEANIPSGQVGGLTLTILLAVIGIVASFPIGVLLALGRRSSLPVVKTFSILYIEIIRGVPLVTVLWTASLLLPLFLPSDIRVDKFIRAVTGITLFSAAYLAENVRGGLQAIPKGQYEAAQALGLNYRQMMQYIILPQALRIVIPALVGQFIALFKDTTLVLIVGLLELLAIARSVISQPEFIGLQREVFVFIALIYWVFSYSMSYTSRRIEERLNVSRR
nr:amino acid ABC transporter permease [Ardenticatena sp.]